MVSRDTREILFRFRGDSRQLQSSSRAAAGSLNKTQTAFGGASKAALGFVAAIGARATGRFILDAAQLAGKADAIASSFEKVYGTDAPRLRTSLDDTRKSVGLSSLEFEELLLNNGLLLKGMGLTEGGAADLGEQFFRAAGDLAAFKGDTGLTEAALHALNRALVGEFDPLEQFVGGLKKSTIQNDLLAAGIVDSIGDITDQQFALGLYDSVMARSQDAVGGLEESQGSLSDKTNRLRADFEDLRLELGESFIPVVQDVTTALIDLKPAFQGAANLLGIVAGQVSRLTGLFTTLKGLFTGDDSVADRIKTATDAIAAFFTFGLADKERFRANLNRIIGQFGDIKGLIDSILRRGNPFRNFKMPSFKLPGIPFFHKGGVVPGPKGANVPIMAQAGETVIPAGQKAGGGGGTVINVTVSPFTSPTETARAVVNLLETYNRNVGPINIRTT